MILFPREPNIVKERSVLKFQCDNANYLTLFSTLLVSIITQYIYI